MAYKNHSKFLFMDYKDIQNAINNDELNEWDVVISRDTHEFILISDNYELVPIKSRVYRFSDLEIAHQKINEQADTYVGQIVAVYKNGTYNAYIVNQDNNRFVLSPLNAESHIDYDSLGEKPITNLTGSMLSPIIIKDLNDGIYKIDGQYEIGQTTYLNTSANLFLVDKKGNETFVKRITPSDIYDYIIDENNMVTKSIVPTQSWIREQGYMTETEMINIITTLGYITKSEIETYINDSINNNLDEKISTIIDSKVQSGDEVDIFEIFNKTKGEKNNG